MFIKLGDGYELHRKPKNYELRLTRKRDDPEKDNFGNSYTKSCGYCANIDGVIKLMTEHGVRSSQINTLRSIIAHQKRLLSKLNRRLTVAVADLMLENQELEALIKILKKKINKLEKEMENHGREENT